MMTLLPYTENTPAGGSVGEIRIRRATDLPGERGDGRALMALPNAGARWA
jgi:hypothetical protein